MRQRSVAVIGGGIIGLAVARELLRRHRDLSVTVLEQEERVGTHQTGHNSGVVHAGVYYPPGSLKADLCRRGRAMLQEYCLNHALPFEEVGKLIVALTPTEGERLAVVERTATANQVPGLRRIGAAEIAEIEPHAVGAAALHSPHTAITDFGAVAEQLAVDIIAAGGEVVLRARVSDIEAGQPVRVVAGSESGPAARVYVVDEVVVCAGLWTDRVAVLAGAPADPAVVPFRGEYLRVDPSKHDLVRGLIYPVPDPRYPFLGVHFTRRVDGAVEIGPNAVLAFSRSDYRRGALDRGDLAQILAWPGTRRLARRHWRTGARELAGSLSVAVVMRAVQRYVPAIGRADVRRGRIGLRAQALGRDGGLIDDFRIERHGGRRGAVTVVRNAPSPAATACLAIAEYVADVVCAR